MPCYDHRDSASYQNEQRALEEYRNMAIMMQYASARMNLIPVPPTEDFIVALANKKILSIIIIIKRKG